MLASSKAVILRNPNCLYEKSEEHGSCHLKSGQFKDKEDDTIGQCSMKPSDVEFDENCNWTEKAPNTLAQLKGHCVWKMDKNLNKCVKDEGSSAIDCDDPSTVVVTEKKFEVDSDQFCTWSALDVTKLKKQTTTLAQVGGHCLWKRDSVSSHCYKDVEASAALADCEDPSPHTVQSGAFETDIDLKCTWE